MPDKEVTEAKSEGQPPVNSFQERMRQRLSAERDSGEPSGPPDGYEEVNPSDEGKSDKVGDGYENALDPARQPDDGGEPELEKEPTGETDDRDGAIPENSEDPDNSDDGDADEMSAEHKELVQRAEQAEQARHDMERDYRVKTHKIAAATRELEDDTGILKQQAEFILGVAEGGVKQFDQVNWAQLQANPEEYQRMRSMFNGAIQQRDLLKKQLGGIADNHKAMVDQAKSREADVSKDILRTSITGWSNKLYGELRGYAVEELSYTAGEFDDITDWRRLRDIHAQFLIAQAPKQVVRLSRKKGKQPVNRQREQKVGQPRDQKGKFQSARRAFHDHPGPGEERRSFFIEKLRAERNR